MKQIRRGKDIAIKWSILTNGVSESLEGRKLTLVAKTPSVAERIIEFLIDGATLLFAIPGVDQFETGTYTFTLWENRGEVGQTAVDSCEAFRLVSSTCKESGSDAGLETTTIQLETSSIEIGLRGLSAYALYMANNPECPLTQEQYAAAPIVAAGRAEQVIERVGQVEVQLELAEGKRVAGESGRAESEVLRAEAEEQRKASESQRTDNELARAESEALRQAATISAIERTATAATSASEATVRADAAAESIQATIRGKVDTIPGKGLSTHDFDDTAKALLMALDEKSYTTQVNTPEWSKQPTVEGALSAAFVAYPEDFYFVTLKASDGQALPAGQFRLTTALDAAYNADPTKAIDQTFTLAGLDTGNSGILKESAPVDFTAVGEAWRLRNGGVTDVAFSIEEKYCQGYDLSAVIYAKAHRVYYMYFHPFASLNMVRSWVTLSGVGDGYGPGNGFLFMPVKANLRKHNISCETLNFTHIPDCWMAEYSRSIYSYNGTLSLRTELQNAVNKEAVNGFCFSTDPAYPTKNLKLGPIKFWTTGLLLNGSSFRLTLKKRHS